MTPADAAAIRRDQLVEHLRQQESIQAFTCDEYGAEQVAAAEAALATHDARHGHPRHVDRTAA